MPRKLPRGLYYHRKTGIIWCRFWVRGREFRRSCSTRDPKVAEVEARRIRVEVEQDPDTAPAPRGQAGLEALAVEDILEHKRRGVSELYVNRLESKWVVILRNMPPDVVATVIDYDALRAYEGRRRAKGARGQTIARELSTIRRALVLAKRRGLLRELPDPWPSVRRDPPDRRRAGKLWPPDLCVAFLGKLHDDAREEVEFALLTGLRLFEVKRVEAGWVEPAPRGAATPALLRVPAWAAKTREERVIGLPAAALDIVRRRVETEPRRPQVFSPSNHRKHRETVAKKIGWPAPPSMRDLRHTYATLALLGTADPVATMRSLGHKDLRTTERYLSSTLDRIASASAAVAAALKAPEHLNRSTEGADEAPGSQVAGKLERATGLEPATFSLEG
jgi:integrase